MVQYEANQTSKPQIHLIKFDLWEPLLNETWINLSQKRVRCVCGIVQSYRAGEAGEENFWVKLSTFRWYIIRKAEEKWLQNKYSICTNKKYCTKCINTKQIKLFSKNHCISVHVSYFLKHKHFQPPQTLHNIHKISYFVPYRLP